MPLAHRYTVADVEAVFARYKQLTGDHSATITIEGHSWHVLNAELKLPRIEGRKAFYITLEAFCVGYESGVRATHSSEFAETLLARRE